PPVADGRGVHGGGVGERVRPPRRRQEPDGHEGHRPPLGPRHAAPSMTVGSLFSGIGGLDLGFERAGFTIRWMCEREPFPRSILAKHWPNVPCYDDVRTLTEPEPVDVLIGGFPCQDISEAGRGAGLGGERSGLWWEMYRVASAMRPRYIVIENVKRLVQKGLDTLLSSLAEIGYDAEWETLSSCAFGAPHT